MGSNWSLEPISEHVALAQGFAVNAKTRHVIRDDGELPLLRITDLINSTQSQFINSDEIADKFIATDEELIFTRTGQVGLVFKNKVGVVHNNCFKIKPKPSLMKDYLYWFLKQKHIVVYLNSIASGSVQKDLNHASFLTLELPIPELKEQKKIAHILGTLDAKIELNRQMNETLEAMAQALFKSWFVDFDPVIDNALAAGNEIPEPLQKRAAVREALGDQRKLLPADIQSLFPDRFVFTEEMGWVPVGWNINHIGEYITLDSGLPYKAKFKAETGLPMMTLGCASFTDRYQSKGIVYYQGEYKKNHLVRPDDLLVASHDVTQERKQLGCPIMVPRWLNSEEILAATNLYIVRNNSYFTSNYLYQIFRTTRFREQMVASAKGTAVLYVSKDPFSKYQVLDPGELLVKKFEERASQLYDRHSITSASNFTLTLVRDTLLPKLLSGELRITDAEKQLAEAL